VDADRTLVSHVRALAEMWLRDVVVGVVMLVSPTARLCKQPSGWVARTNA
jgi:hypothetical protein